MRAFSSFNADETRCLSVRHTSPNVLLIDCYDVYDHLSTSLDVLQPFTNTLNHQSYQWESAPPPPPPPPPTPPEKARSLAIDRQIAQDERNYKNECKILLLGSGESGKSTIVKQMKIIHLSGYSEEELAGYRVNVNRNVVECARAVVGAVGRFGGEWEEGNRVRLCVNTLVLVSATLTVCFIHSYLIL